MVQRIKELCKAKKITIAELERRCGIGNGIIARWKTSKPSYERLALVANELGTTVEYLRSGEEQKESPPPGGGHLDPVTRELMEFVETASDDERRAALEMVKLIKKQRGEQNG